jgi:hypothetical protein
LTKRFHSRLRPPNFPSQNNSRELAKLADKIEQKGKKKKRRKALGRQDFKQEGAEGAESRKKSLFPLRPPVQAAIGWLSTGSSNSVEMWRCETGLDVKVGVG